LFWIAAQRVWFQWKNWLIVVTPETVVGWHRAGFLLERESRKRFVTLSSAWWPRTRRGARRASTESFS
jgi:hypothetical protein